METVGDIQMNWNHCKEIGVEAAIQYLNKLEHGTVLNTEVTGPVPCMGSQGWLRALCWACKWEEGFQCSLSQGSLEVSAG